ncbi:Homeobox protein yox1 [Balamuthia mandrillaris]
MPFTFESEATTALQHYTFHKKDKSVACASKERPEEVAPHEAEPSPTHKRKRKEGEDEEIQDGASLLVNLFNASGKTSSPSPSQSMGSATSSFLVVSAPTFSTPNIPSLTTSCPAAGSVPASPPVMTLLSASPSLASLRKKKRKRRRTSPEEQRILEAVFEREQMPDRQVRLNLARQLNMTPREVQVWFQNKRQKLKRNNESLAAYMRQRREQEKLNALRAAQVAEQQQHGSDMKADSFQLPSAVSLSLVPPVNWTPTASLAAATTTTFATSVTTNGASGLAAALTTAMAPSSPDRSPPTRSSPFSFNLSSPSSPASSTSEDLSNHAAPPPKHNIQGSMQSDKAKVKEEIESGSDEKA